MVLISKEKGFCPKALRRPLTSKSFCKICRAWADEWIRFEKSLWKWNCEHPCDSSPDLFIPVRWRSRFAFPKGHLTIPKRSPAELPGHQKFWVPNKRQCLFNHGFLCQGLFVSKRLSWWLRWGLSPYLKEHSLCDEISFPFLEPNPQPFFNGWKWWFPTISYVKIWFIIQLKQPFINGWDPIRSQVEVQ